MGDFRIKPSDFFLLECHLSINAKPVIEDHQLSEIHSLGVEKQWHIDSDEFNIRTSHLNKDSPKQRLEIFLKNSGTRIVGLNDSEALWILESAGLLPIRYGPLPENVYRAQHSQFEPVFLYDCFDSYFDGNPIVTC